MNKIALFLLTAITASTTAGAQSIAAGAPPYFQQQVDYNIDVTLHDTDHTLDGFIQIQYGNHSPDTLSFIWIHCWPNAFRNDRTAFSEQLLGNGRTDFYFSDKEQKGYINHLEFRVDGQLARMEDHPRYIDIIKVLLPAPLPPGGRITLTTPFHVRLPDNFSRDGYTQSPGPSAYGAYQVTQWYPKPAVYDSHGWHPIPYLDQGGSYNEFGSFDVHITVPKNFIVAATGELQDAPGRQESGPAPVPAAPRTTPASPHNSSPARITHHTSTTRPTTHTTYLTHHTPAPPQPELPTKTLHYHQDNIHDFAWFADTHFHTQHDTLQLAGGRIIDVYSFYTPAAPEAWQHSIQYLKDAIRFRSALIGEYPFNVATAVEIPATTNAASAATTETAAAAGAGYPTIAAIHLRRNYFKTFDLALEQKIGYNWFSGANAYRYPWMSEGINTYYNNRYRSFRYPAQFAEWGFKLDTVHEIAVETRAALREDQPISTEAPALSAKNYALIAHDKAALWVRLLRDSIGTRRFDSLMHDYFLHWQFKHPGPDDLKAEFTGPHRQGPDMLFSLLDKTGPLPAVAAPRYPHILPAIGFNDYDHFMVGLLIHNFNRPPQPWQYLLAPLYATGSHQLNGIVHIAHTWYLPQDASAAAPPGSPRTSAFRKIEAGINGSRFSTISGTDSNGRQLFGGFYKVVPFVRLYFPKTSPRSTQDSWLEWKTWLIGEKQFNNYVQKSTDSLYYPTAGKYSFRYLNQLSLNIRDERALYPYKVLFQVQQAASFYRVNVTGNYFFNYERSGGLDIRVFGAKFGYLGGRNASQDLTPYEPKLTAVRGNEDYTYDNYFIGRNEFSGIASQQIMMRDGDLKLRTDLFQGLQGRSDNWVASLNLSSTLPPQVVPAWMPLKVFLDIGTYAQAWQQNPPTSHFLYTGGLELSLFHDVFRIYAPLVYSSDFSNQLKTVAGQNGLFQKMSFSIDFQNINFRKFTGNTPF